jgi:hypothetical protein
MVYAASGYSLCLPVLLVSECVGRGKTARLSVFKGREAKLNRAIIETLALQGPLTIPKLRKQVIRHKGLEETYYASLNKRIHRLEETGYVRPTKKAEGTSKAQGYEARTKAILASFLDTYNIQHILDEASDEQAARILLVLLDIVLPGD